LAALAGVALVLHLLFNRRHPGCARGQNPVFESSVCPLRRARRNSDPRFAAAVVLRVDFTRS
jgi:hypothetical protein